MAKLWVIIILETVNYPVFLMIVAWQERDDSGGQRRSWGLALLLLSLSPLGFYTPQAKEDTALGKPPKSLFLFSCATCPTGDEVLGGWWDRRSGRERSGPARSLLSPSAHSHTQVQFLTNKTHLETAEVIRLAWGFHSKQGQESKQTIF